MAKQIAFKTYLKRFRRNLLQGLSEGSYKFGLHWAYFLLAIGGIILFIYVLITLLLLIDKDLFGHILTKSIGVYNAPDSAMNSCTKDAAEIYQKIGSGSILSQSDFLSVISNFYNSIITVLTTLIAILGFVSFFYLRNLSKQNAYEIVNDILSQKLTGDSMRHALSSDESWNEYLERLNKKADSIESFRDELKRIQDALQALAFSIEPTSALSKRLIELEEKVNRLLGVK